MMQVCHSQGGNGLIALFYKFKFSIVVCVRNNPFLYNSLILLLLISSLHLLGYHAYYYDIIDVTYASIPVASNYSTSI